MAIALKQLDGNYYDVDFSDIVSKWSSSYYLVSANGGYEIVRHYREIEYKYPVKEDTAMELIKALKLTPIHTDTDIRYFGYKSLYSKIRVLRQELFDAKIRGNKNEIDSIVSDLGKYMTAILRDK